MEPMVDIDHVPTSEITTTKTPLPISVRASTLIPAVPKQLGSASSSAPLTVSVSVALTTTRSMSLIITSFIVCVTKYTY